MKGYNYSNPILPGFHPDPSICRVGKDFYLVNSTFEYFPGVPVYHSTDLINWELTGYCLCDREHIDLDGVFPSQGIFAPTIRYHDGYFFMTVTNVTHGGNFIVHSRSAAGPWSAPAYVRQQGIDPTLFFDDDGKTYFISTGGDSQGRSVIQLSEIDPMSGELKSEPVVISRGCIGRSPEGPHMYRIDGRYYLMLAEGGTEYGHMETIQRSDSVTGPFEQCPNNPVITNKDAEVGEICACGHADLTDDMYGNWWLVCLGIRDISFRGNPVMLHNLGRETFLAPVRFEDGWPVVGENGRIEPVMSGPLPVDEHTVFSDEKTVSRPSWDFTDDFSSEEMPLEYSFLRMPEEQNYERKAGVLTLHGTDVSINDAASPSWLGIRQPGFNVAQTAAISRAVFSGENARAGITAYYSKDYHYDIFAAPSHSEGKIRVVTARHIHDLYAVTGECEIDDPTAGHGGKLYLQIEASREAYVMKYSADGEDYKTLDTASAAGLCTEGTMYMTFTGTYLGMFAENCTADFNLFKTEEGVK